MAELHPLDGRRVYRAGGSGGRGDVKSKQAGDKGKTPSDRALAYYLRLAHGLCRRPDTAPRCAAVIISPPSICSHFGKHDPGW